MYLGNACVPGSLSITVSGVTITDDGGDLKVNGTTPVGSISYSQGLLSFSSSSPTYTGTKSISFRPAARVLKVLDTASIQVVPQNRGYAYTITLHPKPAPGSLFIDYRSQGKWYRLYDKGNGACKGFDSGYGSASVNYSTGSVILTCGALPDNGSFIIFYWGTPVSTFNRSTLTPPTPKIEIQLDHFPVAPNTFSIDWEPGKSLTDNGLGVLTGNGGSGTIVYSTGKVTIQPTILPLGGATFTANYSYGTPLTKTFPHPSRNGQGQLVLMLDYTGIIPKSVEVEYNVLIDDYNAYVSTSTQFIFTRSNWVDPIVQTRDNGSGAFTIGQTVEGSINYTTGTVTITPDLTVQIPKPLYSNHPLGTKTSTQGNLTTIRTTYRHLFDGWEYIPAPAKFPIDETGYVTVRYRASDSPSSSVDETHTIGNLNFDLTNNYVERIVERFCSIQLWQ